MQVALEAHLRSVTAWLRERPGIAVHWVNYLQLVAEPHQHASEIDEFLGGGLNTQKMAAQVDPALFRKK
jgi:hypothetical protein